LPALPTSFMASAFFSPSTLPNESPSRNVVPGNPRIDWTSSIRRVYARRRIFLRSRIGLFVLFLE
jgi:hypothetical protein